MVREDNLPDQNEIYTGQHQKPLENIRCLALLHTHTHARTHTHTHTRTHTHTYALTHTHTHACACARTVYMLCLCMCDCVCVFKTWICYPYTGLLPKAEAEPRPRC